MAERLPTPTVENETDIPATGAEKADQLIDAGVERATTVATVRSEVSVVLTEVQGDEEATARVEEYRETLATVSAGHEHVELQEMQGGLQGLNQVGTHHSRANQDLFTANNLIEDRENVDEVLDHEDDEATGHAGQEPGKAGLVMRDGEPLAGTELYEGENEAQQGKDKRGSASVAREGQPKETYGSGQQKAAPHLESLEKYLRDGADRLVTQAEILRGKSREEIVVVLQKSGMYRQEEIGQVVQMAA